MKNIFNHRPSWTIMDHERPSVTIRDHQISSEIIRDNHSKSKTITNQHSIINNHRLYYLFYSIKSILIISISFKFSSKALSSESYTHHFDSWVASSEIACLFWDQAALLLRNEGWQQLVGHPAHRLRVNITNLLRFIKINCAMILTPLNLKTMPYK